MRGIHYSIIRKSFYILKIRYIYNCIVHTIATTYNIEMDIACKRECALTRGTNE